MIIMWRGWGISVPVIFFSIGALGQRSIDSLFGIGTYSRYAYFLFPLVCLLSAGIV